MLDYSFSTFIEQVLSFSSIHGTKNYQKNSDHKLNPLQIIKWVQRGNKWIPRPQDLSAAEG